MVSVHPAAADSPTGARIGERLLREGRITAAQLEEALHYQSQRGGRVGGHLVKLGLVTSSVLAGALSRQYGVPSVALSRCDIDPSVTGLISAETARKYCAVPLVRVGTTLTVAMADPSHATALDDLRFMTACTVEPVVASEQAMLDAIEKHYGRTARVRGDTVLALASQALAAAPELAVEPTDGVGDPGDIGIDLLAARESDAPIIGLVNLLLATAVRRGASDIHIEPYDNELRVRYRIDGVLYPVMTPPLRLKDAITSRIKIMARLDIAEKRLPQDGRMKVRLEDRGEVKDVDLRVSSLPTLFGERVVLRLLDRDTLMLETRDLGFEPESLAVYEAAIRRPWGMVLVTGPTGSGKTNTLYSSIAHINTPDTNILTAEDPVEFNLTGVNQLQVREGIGLTFAAALRSFLRQDPNVILVGEIRDAETAEIAIKAALTGHLVLSTLHTNDAPSTISRLMNMGVEPFLVASSLNLVCAQRLVRRICRHCVEPHHVPPAALIEAGFPPDEARIVAPARGRGCDECSGTGYRGRIGLYEVMEITDALRQLILGGASAAHLRRAALDAGMIALRQSGLRKVRDRITTVDEILRETVK